VVCGALQRPVTLNYGMSMPGWCATIPTHDSKAIGRGAAPIHYRSTTCVHCSKVVSGRAAENHLLGVHPRELLSGGPVATYLSTHCVPAGPGFSLGDSWSGVSMCLACSAVRSSKNCHMPTSASCYCRYDIDSLDRINAKEDEAGLKESLRLERALISLFWGIGLGDRI
jgi:hypothetical protein